jgi:D-mannonate dehydratase
MRETCCWFGRNDAITLPQIARTGASGIVPALHDILFGDVWTRTELAAPVSRMFGDRLHFTHLRSVRKEANGSLEEAAHLDGDTDTVAVIPARLEAANRTAKSISFQPNHGHDLLKDKTLGTQAGYPPIRRLRGLAERRGVIAAHS